MGQDIKNKFQYINVTVLDENTGVYILQNTMVVGGGEMAAGKKLKLRGWGKNEKEGKMKKEKNDFKNASLRVKNSKIFAPPGASGKKNNVL